MADITGSVVSCPHCHGVVAVGDVFCESCGAELIAPAAGIESAEPAIETVTVTVADGVGVGVGVGAEIRTHVISAPVKGTEAAASPAGPSSRSGERRCSSCNGTFEDGWCTTCGAREQSERDHFEIVASTWVAGVCDRGIRHSRNEDALAIVSDASSTGRCAIVVCDGVTNATDSDKASAAAVAAACAVLGQLVLTTTVPERAAGPGASVSARITTWTSALTEAAAAANAEAVRAAGDPPVKDPAASTFAAAIVDDDLLVAAWVGDSRIYWLPDAGPAVQLSVDHSWATQQIAAGMPRALAEADDQAHAITRWLGVDAPDPVPACATAVADTPGWLLVCSDGLWNYCSDPKEIADLVTTNAAASAEPVAVSRALVAWANSQGGHDNITAALARIEPGTADVAVGP